MTREEAIDILTRPDEIYQDVDGLIGYTYNPRKRNYEAFQLAIQALEQKSCEDAVSRKAVLDLAETIQTDDFSGNEILDVVEVNDIKALPPVTPTRKKGKWVKAKNGRGGHECNVCQMYAPSYQSGDEYLSKFCPNCGIEIEMEE